MIINLNLENDKDLIKIILEHLEKKIETNEVVEQHKRGRGRPRIYPPRDPNEPRKPRGRPRKHNIS
jgi:hypothetical protein